MKCGELGFFFWECCGLYKVVPIQNETQVAQKPSLNPSLYYTPLHLCLTMWKATFLTVGLLVALVDRGQCTEDHPSFYGVKLCGREFIRAVIFTCGGSRWRRSVGDQGKNVCARLMDEGSFLLTYTVRLYKIHPFPCRISSWRRGLWLVEGKQHPQTYPWAESFWVPSVERSNGERGIFGRWIQPLGALTDLRGCTGGPAECRQERAGCGGRTVQCMLQVGLQQEWNQLSVLNLVFLSPVLSSTTPLPHGCTISLNAGILFLNSRYCPTQLMQDCDIVLIMWTVLCSGVV